MKTKHTKGEKYQVIYADPPWKIGSIVLDRGKWKSPLSDKYPTMDLGAIKNLKISDIEMLHPKNRGRVFTNEPYPKDVHITEFEACPKCKRCLFADGEPTGVAKRVKP